MDSLCIYWYKMFLIYTTQIYKLYLGYRCKFDQTLSNSALKILKISRIIYRNCLKEDDLFNFFSICEYIYQHCIYRSISHTEKFNIYTKQIVYFSPIMSKQELCTNLRRWLITFITTPILLPRYFHCIQWCRWI